MKINELTAIQAKTLIDLRQANDVWRAADQDMRHRFSGSMRWQERNGCDYLMRKIGNSEKSLGRREPRTETIYQAFIDGRAAGRGRPASLTKAVESQAAIARATGLGRVPSLTARLFRALERARILGHIRIGGTNALYAYEALGGVQFSADAPATGDVDLLVDARKRLRLMVSDPSQRTVLGLLQKLDHSFQLLPNKPYCVANADGFMVDLIRQQPSPAWQPQPGAAQLAPGDLAPAALDGLQWLAHCPAVDTFVIDDRGFPAPIVAPDPRVWMAHKMWLSRRADREPVKKHRDAMQAKAVWWLVDRHLPQFALDDTFTATLPKPLSEAFDLLRPEKVVGGEEHGDTGWTPPEPWTRT